MHNPPLQSCKMCKTNYMAFCNSVVSSRIRGVNYAIVGVVTLIEYHIRAVSNYIGENTVLCCS